MPITYQKNIALFDNVVSVEEAEDLLEWIQKNPKGKVDLSLCTYLHAADLQVLMATNIAVVSWPQDENLKNWLLAAMDS
jgi:hypothetical protein